MPWVEPVRAAVRLGLQRVREVASHGSNAGALDLAAAHVRASPGLAAGTAPTRLRLLDVLAWSTVRRSG